MSLRFEQGPSREMKMEMKMEPEPPEPEDEIIRYRISEKDFEIAREIHEKDKEKFLEKLEAKEIEPTLKQQELLEDIDTEISNFLDDYNIECSDAAYQRVNFKFLSFQDYKELALGMPAEKKRSIPRAVGVYIPEKKTAIAWYYQFWKEDNRNHQFIHTTSHEMVHAKAFQNLQFYKREQELKVAPHRIGLEIIKLGVPEQEKEEKKEKPLLFRGLNEAITEEIAVEITNGVVNENREEFKPTILGQIRYLIERSRKPNDTRERAKELGYHFGRNTEEQAEKNQMICERIFSEGFKYQFPSRYLAYKKERKVFDRLVKAITKRNEEFEGDEEKVRTLFYDAYFNGSMLKIGRLIDKTFPRKSRKECEEKGIPREKGTFRLVAEDFLGEELKKRLSLRFGKRKTKELAAA